MSATVKDGAAVEDGTVLTTKRRVASLARGEFQGGQAPYGYRVGARGVLEVDLHEAERVRWIFGEYLKRESLGDLAAALNETKLRARTGRAWSKNVLGRILRNPAVLGKVRLRGAVHDGAHRAIVELATFEAVQAKLDRCRDACAQAAVFTVLPPDPGDAAAISSAGETRPVVDRDLKPENALTPDRVADMSLLEAFDLWLAEGNRWSATAARYKASILRLARLGLTHVRDLTRDRVARAQVELLARGWAHDSVRNEFGAARALLAFLDDDREPSLLAPGQLAGVRKAALKREVRRRRRVRFLTRDEFDRLAEGAARVAPRFELPIRVAVLSGVRVGELARMQAEDVSGGTISIDTLPEWGEAGSCKTGARTVPVCAELRELLEMRLPRSGWFFPAHRSWTHPAKRPFVTRAALERALRKLRRALGISDDITWTVLRHTRASWWLQGGASIYKVADWLGHSVATCETYYGSLVDAYDPDCEAMPAPASSSALGVRSATSRRDVRREPPARGGRSRPRAAAARPARERAP